MKLHDYLGISGERYNSKILPLMNRLHDDGMRTDHALMKISSDRELSPIEKEFCFFLAGRLIGQEEAEKAGRGIIRRLGFLNLKGV
jgi:hypothetical protein